MNSEKILTELGNISDRYIDEAAPEPSARRKRTWIKWTALAACLALAAVGGGLYHAEHPYPVRPAQAPAMTHSEVAEVPHWEDLEIYQQYSEVTWDGARYCVHGAEIPAGRLGASLGPAAAEGWDAYAETDGLKTRGAEVFAIEGIRSHCAVAVRYEDGGSCYAAVNSYYRPETLGQFLDDLDLRGTLEVNWASYEYKKPLSGRTATVRFDAVPMEALWTLLETSLDAENTWSDLDNYPPERMGLSVSIPLLGYENISLSLLEDNSLTTNILDTGKRFQLDEAAAEAFVQSILRECEGYELAVPDDNAFEEFIPE